MTAASYVFQTPEGGWRLADSRVSLDSIVHAYWQGRLPEAIAADFPSLSLEQIHGAIAFYLRNREELDEYLSSQESRWQELLRQSETTAGPLLQRLRAAGAATNGQEKSS
jgi:uncharacterized protein (DUF433 family)